MANELRFGVITLQNVPWEQEANRWRRIDELGFDSVWVADHFVDYTRPSSPWFEAWTLLAALASQTSRIRVGTLVSNVFWRNPAFLARHALTVDHISNGRLELGIGAGASADADPTYSMTGLKYWRAGERVARFKENVEILDRLLRNEVTTYRGRYYSLEETVMNPQPLQKPRPPITIGALGPRMLRIAAQYADAWNTFGGMDLGPTEMLEKVSRDNELLDAYCEEIDRDPDSLRRSLLAFGKEAWELYDSEENFENFVAKYRETGITEFITYYPWTEEHLRVFEHVATEVIPELR
jgi:alkanesulfonate monooxygenase SsuD/methylene tetrahydromethanopterin reductase-like flavin-dependent oxidoreductase (luciferase family)